MSAPTSSSVVVPTGKDGAPDASKAAAATQMKGGMMLSPLPLGGGKRRKTRRISKKVLRMFMKGSKAKLMKLMKGGQDGENVVTGNEDGGRRKSRRGSRKSRKHPMLY